MLADEAEERSAGDYEDQPAAYERCLETVQERLIKVYLPSPPLPAYILDDDAPQDEMTTVNVEFGIDPLVLREALEKLHTSIDLWFIRNPACLSRKGNRYCRAWLIDKGRCRFRIGGKEEGFPKVSDPPSTAVPPAAAPRRNRSPPA